MSKRNQLQKKAIEDITNTYYSEKGLFFGEYPTGSGKTKILLESAIKILHERDTSVIIATANNALVLDMLSKAKEYNIPSEHLEVLIGKKNYVDLDVIRSQVFLKEAGLSLKQVADYLEVNPEPLIYDFIEHFHLPHLFEDVIGFVDLEVPVDDLLVQEKISNKFAQKIASITTKKKVFVTNHFFLILIYAQIGRTNMQINEIAKMPILMDEAHQINDAATAFFSNTFSPYRLSIYLSLVSETKMAKKDTAMLHSFNKYFKEICTIDKSEAILEKLKDDVIQKNKFDKLKVLVNKLNEKKGVSVVEQKHLKNLKQELMEMIYLMKKPYLNVSFSAIKKVPTISSVLIDSAIGLRNMWVKNKSMIVGISGTFRISKYSGFHENEWSFKQIGFLRFKPKDGKLLDKYSQRWNDRISNNRTFLIEESIFDKNQAIRFILDELYYTPPKVSKDSKLSVEHMQNWIENIAKKMASDFIYKNCLILMTSFENCEMLYNELSKKENLQKMGYRILYSTSDKSMRYLQEEYKKLAMNGNRTILIGNISFFTGIDLPNELINTLIIGKLPFEPNNFLKKRTDTDNNYGSVINNRNKAIITFRQGIGRGLRNNHDRVFIAVCDPRIYDKKNSSFLYFIESMSVPHKMQKKIW